MTENSLIIRNANIVDGTGKKPFEGDVLIKDGIIEDIGKLNGEIGQEIDAESDAAIVESVKAASDVYSPLSGKITEANSMLEEQPETVNSSPFEDGWFFKMTPSDLGELESLLSPEDYNETCQDWFLEKIAH